MPKEFCTFVDMKQTLEEYIRQNEKFQQALLNQQGGIMKFWAQHPEAEFDSELFEHYEEKIKEDYIHVNKRVHKGDGSLCVLCSFWHHGQRICPPSPATTTVSITSTIWPKPSAPSAIPPMWRYKAYALRKVDNYTKDLFLCM